MPTLKKIQLLIESTIPLKRDIILYTSRFETALGSMVAIADQNALYLLEFENQNGLERSIARLKQKTKAEITPGNTKISQLIQHELTQYFTGNLCDFKTPLCLLGTAFQEQVWAALRNIPFGETRAYAALANALGKPSAFRAVAQANGANPIAIVVPCHRVINQSGALGGYAGGIERKQALLELEHRAMGF